MQEIDRNIDSYLKITDFENFLDIYQNKKDNQYIFNLNKNLYIKISNLKTLPEFICQHDMHWPLISYHIYGTTRLVWILLKINNINKKDILKIIKAGQKIKYIQKDQVESIIVQINGYSEN